MLSLFVMFESLYADIVSTILEFEYLSEILGAFDLK